MIRSLSRLTVVALAVFTVDTAVAPCLAAQSPAALKRELRKREREAKKDVEALLEVAEWAEEKGLVRDHRRLLQSVIALDPDNGPAHEALGYVKYEGEWIEKAEVEKRKNARLAEEMKAKGLVEVDGIWVTEKEKADAEKGIFVHDGEVVAAWEKAALQRGMVRHPATGLPIEAADLPKAENGLFPVAGGEWVEAEKADRFHAQLQTPWVVRTYSTWLVSTLPMAKIQEIQSSVDNAIQQTSVLFGSETPRGRRPVVFVVRDAEQQRALGEQVGGSGSAYGVFLAEEAVDMGVLGRVRPAVAEFHQSWGPYYTRHAAALGAAHAWGEAVGAELPGWFLRGVGSLASRHQNTYVASFFGKQHDQKGGIPDLSTWFSSFAISPDNPSSLNDALIYQAGLNLSFAMQGGDQATTDALMAVTKAFETGKGVAEAIEGLEAALIASQDAQKAWFAKLIQG